MQSVMMMSSTVSEESLARDTHPHTDRHTHTHTHTQTRSGLSQTSGLSQKTSVKSNPVQFKMLIAYTFLDNHGTNFKKIKKDFLFFDAKSIRFRFVL